MGSCFGCFIHNSNFQFQYFLYIHVGPACVSCTMCIPAAHRCQKRGSDPLELDFTEHCELPFKLGPLENQLNTNFLFHEPGDLKSCLQTEKTVQWLTVDFEILLWLSHLQSSSLFSTLSRQSFYVETPMSGLVCSCHYNKYSNLDNIYDRKKSLHISLGEAGPTGSW